MNLCVVTSSFPANSGDYRAAAGLFVRDFCLTLAGLGHRVTVVTPDLAGIDKQSPPGVDVCWYPRRGGAKGLVYLKPWRPADLVAIGSVMRQGRLALERLAAERRFDHVMAMWAVPAGWLARGLKKKLGIPYTVWCLGSDITVYGRMPLLNRVVRAAIGSADHVQADGMGLAAEVTRLTGRPCAFVPTSRTLDKGLARPVAPPLPSPRFLFIGRLTRVKGVDVLLEAMARMRASGHAGHLTIIGGGPLDAFVRERATRPDLAGCVTVHGYADEADYISQLAACDCSLIPSRSESIPLVMSEALQMGKPAIVSDVGDMGTLLREIPAGIVVPPGDPDALCNAMIEFSRRGAAPFAEAVAKLASHFDLAQSAAQWIKRIL